LSGWLPGVPRWQGIALQAQLSCVGQAADTQLPELTLSAAVCPTAVGEELRLDVLPLLPASAKGEEPGSLALLHLLLHTHNQGRSLEAKYHAVLPEPYGALLGRYLRVPSLSLQAQGLLTYTLPDDQCRLAGLMDVYAGGLGDLSPQLTVLGPVHLSQKWDLLLSPFGLEVKVLQAKLAEQKGRLLAACELSQPFEVTWLQGQISVDKAHSELLRLELLDLPMAYLKPFLPAYTLQGKPLRLAVGLEVDPQGNLVAQTLGPATLAGISLSRAGDVATPCLEQISVTCPLKATYTGKTLQLLTQGQGLRVENARAQTLLHLEGGCTLHFGPAHSLEYVDLDTTLAAHLAAWAQQPIWAARYPVPPPEPMSLALLSKLQYDCTRREWACNQLTLQAVPALAALGRSVQPGSVPNAEQQGLARRPYAVLECLQPVRLALAADPAAMLEGLPSGDLLELHTDHFPFAWVQPWLPAHRAGIRLAAQTLQGSVLLQKQRKPRLTGSQTELWALDLSTLKPLEATGMVLHLASGQDTQPVALRLQLDSWWSPACSGLKMLDLRCLDLQKPTEPILVATAQGQYNSARTQPLQDLTASVQVDLAQALAVYPVPGSSNLEGGLLRASLHMPYVAAQQQPIRLSMQVKNLDFVEPAYLIGLVAISCDATLDLEKSTLSWHAPLEMDGYYGDTQLHLQGVADWKNHHYSVQVKGEHLFVDDVLLLGQAIAPRKGLETAPAAPLGLWGGSTVADSHEQTRLGTPFWGPYGLDVHTQLGQLHYGAVLVKGLAVDAAMDRAGIQLKQLKATISQADLQAQASLRYQLGAAQPYKLGGSVQVKDLDLGRLLKEWNAGQASPVEGIFGAQAQFHAQAADEADLLNKLQGKLYLEGRQGVLKTFEATPKGVRKGAQLISLTSALLGQQSAGLDFAGQVVDFFATLPFDRFELQAQRYEGLDVQIGVLKLQGPDVSLGGHGQVSYRADKPFLQQPLSLHVQLYAKNKAAALLNTLGLLQSKVDPNGYTYGPHFEVGGTVAKPDFGDLYRLLIPVPFTTFSSLQPIRPMAPGWGVGVLACQGPALEPDL
jgi:hypothetical protein